MESLYSQYIREKTNDYILENKKGFATYTFSNETDCWIKDVYIVPKYRKKGLMSQFGDEIAEIAKQKGCKRILGSIVVSTKNSTDALKALLSYGMKLDSSTNDFILLSKEIQ